VIVTALSLECLAVCQHLKNRHQDTHPGGTVYERGAFQPESGREWDVLVVEAGAGNTGAAVEVERAISFFHPRLAIFAGVAGGLKDVHIGDVVVANKVYAYESGKERDQFDARPEIHMPDYRLAQRARAEIRDGSWVKRIQGQISADAPRAFFGPIAAGEKVIASTSSATHQFLKERYSDALAVDMEGYGFLHGSYMNPDVGALVVRGISDLIDAKSAADAEGSQERAAQAASAFTFELLTHLEPGQATGISVEVPAESDQKRFRADARVEKLIQNIKLADWDKAADAALDVVKMTDSSSGRNEIFEALFPYQHLPDDDNRFWGAMHTLESCVRVAPWLISRRQHSQLATHGNFSVRASAASICMDLAHSAPALVPLDILLKLGVYDEDWYVEAPAMAIVKLLMLTRRHARVIFDRLATSDEATDRYDVAAALLDIAQIEPAAVPPDLVQRLVKDEDELVKTKAEEVAEVISTLPEGAYSKRYQPFGI
jgi:nucleoside phosphorylase